MKQICEYEAFDGTRFKSPYECKKYENYINYSSREGQIIEKRLYGTTAIYLKDCNKDIEEFIFSHELTKEQLLKYVCTFHTNSEIGTKFKVLFMNSEYAFIEVVEGLSKGFYFTFRIEHLPELN